MTVADDLLLLAVDAGSGRMNLRPWRSDATLGRAALVELVRRGRLTLEGEGRAGRFVLASAEPVEDPALESAFARVRQRGRQTSAAITARLGRGYRAAALEQLQADGRVRRLDRTVLGIPLQRYAVVDEPRRDDLLGRIDATLLQAQPADDETGPLIVVLAAGNLLRLVVPPADLRRARKRAEEVRHGDWADESLRRTVAALSIRTTAAR